MHKHHRAALLSTGLLVAMISSHANAAPKAAGPILDKFLPAKVPGWKIDPPVDPEGMFDHTTAINQTYHGATQSVGLDIGIHRFRPNSEPGVPIIENNKPGPLTEIDGYVSFENINGRKGLLEYKRADRRGTLVMVTGLCSVTVEAYGVTPAQINAAAAAVDMKGLDAVCK
jgi:hypothetical protein